MRAVGLAIAAGALLAGAALLVLGTSRASDHLDGPRATADPQADLTDVFAFTSPENPGHVVLAMGVAPFASDAATFAAGVDYVFRVRRFEPSTPPTIDATALDVTCSFTDADAGAQRVTCTAPGGLTRTVAVGDASGGGDASQPLRVFAGLRSDPAFFDRRGAAATLASGRASFTGANAYAGANVLALVVELDVAKAFGSPEAGVASPMIAVAAETSRRTP